MKQNHIIFLESIIFKTCKEFLQRDTNGLQKISTRAHKEQNLISTHFSNLTNEQDTQ